MGSDNIPERMLAAQVTEYNKPYTIHEIAVPKNLDPQDILVKVAVASLCHTDNMVIAGQFFTQLPCTASHEGSGTVVLTGSEVKNFKPGDRVMCAIPYHQCGICNDCQSASAQYCAKQSLTGVKRDGCFAEYVVVDGRTSIKLPDRVSFETAAPMACAGLTIFRGVLQSECHAGEWMGIVGAGGSLGHLGIQFAKAMGIMVVGVDARDEGLALAKETGADIVVDARKGAEQVVKEVEAVTGGEGCKSTLMVSDADGAVALGCKITRMHGTLVQIAQPETISIPFHEVVFRDIKIHGSLMSSVAEATRMLDVVAEHGVSVEKNVFHGLHEIPKLMDLAHGGKMKGKGMIVVDQEQIDRQNSQGLKLS
ncbi:GroES-like protein [Rhizodiscina lignyota]|uniref:GroES-like protein n=1 Tax=Rhizodiscina lignyota TaxID=1504668 RepID=A0A9P4M3N0_9PEZI|nr:GroES-like protein [Rhizodiscina lignyota]